LTANNVIGGPYIVTASVDGTGLSANFTLENLPAPGVPVSITIVDGNNQQKAITRSFDHVLRVKVLDFFNNPVGGASVRFTAPSTGPSATFTSNGLATETVSTDSSGIASSSVIIANGATGTYSIDASVDELGSTVNFSFTNSFTPGVPTSIIVTSGSNQSKPINQNFNSTFVAQVFDGNGEVVGGVNVTFAAPNTGASGVFYSSGTASETVVTNTAGYATSSRFTANNIAGSYVVNASTIELTGNPAVFSVQNLDQAGIAKSMSFIQGDDQSSIVNRAFYTPLAVKVLDDYGRPAGGVDVTFTINPNGSFYGRFPNDSLEETVVTNTNGVAIAPALKAGPTENGSFTVTVSVPGLTSLVSDMSTRRFLANTYSAQQWYSLPGAFLCNESTNPCTSAPVQPDANAAHEYALGTLNLYLSKHGRNSVTNSGELLKSSVQYCHMTEEWVFVCPFYNAFWDGQQMVYGTGYNFAGSDDVVAHELTHGVTEHESDLYYSFQSGAINESLSDLWGEYFDQTNGQGNDAANVKWLVGEETGAPGGAFRDMNNPPHFLDPDRMMSSYFYKGTDDNGGVHTNSGVNNKAVALMVDGGTFNTKTVRALGWDKVAAIYYEAQSNLLGNASNYSDLYYAVQQACINIGLPDDDCFEVKKALDAVQMNTPITGATVNQVTAPLCPAGMTTSPDAAYFNETFDGDSFDLNGWFKDSLIYTSPAMAVRTSGGNGAFYTLTMANSLLIKPGSYLHFNHYYDFESYAGGYNFDGGVIEYFKGEYTSNGPVWRDASSLFLAGAPYNGSITSYAYNPNLLQGRRAYVGYSDAVSTSHCLSMLWNSIYPNLTNAVKWLGCDRLHSAIKLV
jgi:hypothetical protein